MSDLWSGWNREKCGLVLNDSIDWFKLHLNEPKKAKEHYSILGEPIVKLILKNYIEKI